MKTFLTALIAALAMVVSVGSARAQTTLGFDDLPTLPGGGILGLDAPALYQGLDFSNAAFNSRWYWDTDTGPWVAASGPHSLSTRDGLGLGLIEGATITSSTPFTFGGAFFSGLAVNVFIELTAVDGTRERLGGFDYSFASGATFSLASGPLSFVNPLSGLSLSAITVWAETGSFAMDDLLINGIAGDGPPVAPIPEPSTYALMALGLAAVAWQSKRRRPAATVPA
ncbi:MAG: PEP-CTERM sorting domain-containing protein [Rubrivivax sp.]|nr:PEP-CTERM sorting domain-containing protein [Rubrivivax sp.]